MRKCALAVVINSGSAEHKSEHWLTNKEQVHILPPVALSARSYYKAVLCVYFSNRKKGNTNPKPSNLAQFCLISTFQSQKTSNRKISYSRSVLTDNSVTCKTLLLISCFFDH